MSMQTNSSEENAKIRAYERKANIEKIRNILKKSFPKDVDFERIEEMVKISREVAKIAKEFQIAKESQKEKELQKAEKRKARKINFD